MMMMMLGSSDHHPRSNPTVHIPPSPYDHLNHLPDPTAHIHQHQNSPNSYDKALSALQRYLPSNFDNLVPTNPNNNLDISEEYDEEEDFDFPTDAFSSDHFRIFDFKVKRCARARSHDWTECPFAHPGEKARRRDPRKFHYSGSACPEFRKGACKKGDACEHAHGVFECWLHPARYRTQPCKDGTHCRRRICFFAHTPDQLRVLPETASFSPPPSPGSGSGSGSGSPPFMSQLAESMRVMGINKNKMKMGMGLSVSSPGWGVGYGSPVSPPVNRISGFLSLPATPVQGWESGWEEEPVMERVESGRALRERIYEKLGKENSLDRVGRVGGY